MGETPAKDIGSHVGDLLEEIAADLHESFGGGSFSAVPYDTAWVAMVRDPQSPDILAYPESLRWLLANQRNNGSWGEEFPHSLLPTLAGLLAMLCAPNQTDEVRTSVRQAKQYLEIHLNQWSVDQHESVGFELVAPALLDSIRLKGICFSFPNKEELLELFNKKTMLAGPQMVYDKSSNLAHSLEAFGDKLDFIKLQEQRAVNGGYGCSPAATASVLIHNPIWDEQAAAWLTHLSERKLDGVRGAMPNAYPIDVFETAWALYNLAHANLLKHAPASTLQQLTDWLVASITEDGASICRNSALPCDSDDTSMVITALNMCRVPTSADTLRRFERTDHFACFERERGISLSANAHVLDALLSLPQSEQGHWSGSINKIVDLLCRLQSDDGLWQDKWHLSPYYATSCASLALSRSNLPTSTPHLLKTREWLLGTQRVDGGWGLHHTTAEESAYALQSLYAISTVLPSSDQYIDAMSRGQAYLTTQISASDMSLAKLWLGKELYAPRRVIRSAILSAVSLEVPE